MPDSRLLVYHSPAGQYYFRLADAGGRLRFTSTDYYSRDACLAALRSFHRAVALETSIRRRFEAGEHSFELLSTQGERLGCSTSYSTLHELNEAMRSLAEQTRTAIVIDYSAHVRYFTKTREKK